MNKETIVDFESSHVEEAIKLLAAYYQFEKEVASELPSFIDYTILLKKNLQLLAEKGQGIALLENGCLIGYMAGYPIDALFGEAKGIFVPVFGHAAEFSRRIEIEQELYIKAAEKWVSQNIFTHSIAVFASDKDQLDLWHQLGFGNRCVDAIRKVKPRLEINLEFSFEEITIQNAYLVEKLHQEHNRYYRLAPMFMPTQEEDALADLIDWLSNNKNRMFCVKYNEIVAGYIRFQSTGESIFSFHPNMRNITGLYVLPLFRNLGIGEMLLHHIESILDQEKFTLLGVDYESINPKANRFWKKHFNPYTYSLVRRIDERVNSIRS